MADITIVTGLWNINRGTMENTSAGHDWNRSFKKYTDQLELLLSTGLPVIVFGDEEIDPIIAKYSNAVFAHYPKEKFETEFPYFDKINEIRISPEWYNQPTAQWLKSSPQAVLPYYIPITISKLYFVKKASELNPFKSSRFYWMDGGICKNHDPSLIRAMVPKLLKYSKFWFFSHHYTDNTEIHGFLRTGVHKYCGVPFVDRIMKAFFFGGSIDRISEIVTLYNTIIESSLTEKLLGTEETYFTIMVNQKPELFDKVIIRSCSNTTQYL